jgi:hypothetical protein
MYSILIPLLFSLISYFSPIAIDWSPGTDALSINAQKFLAQEKISLENRYNNEFVNDVFKDNILLNIAYLSGKITKKEEINWDEIIEPFNYRFVLAPGKTFAFHDDVMPEYKNSLVKTTNAHFNYSDGFKSSGYLYGDGVCHLASLMHLAAKNAGLDTNAPTSHNFAVIPEIPREHGVSIYMSPGNHQANSMQNLYITNNKSQDIVFEFNYSEGVLGLNILET